MIVAQTIEYLRVRLHDPSAQKGCLTEVELGAFDGPNFTGRNLLGIGRQERLGGDGDLVVQHVAGGGTAKIEIGMRAQVHDRRLGRPRLERSATRCLALS